MTAFLTPKMAVISRFATLGFDRGRRGRSLPGPEPRSVRIGYRNLLQELDPEASTCAYLGALPRTQASGLRLRWIPQFPSRSGQRMG